MPNYEFDVLVHKKSTVKYAHDGRYYIEGRPGSEFTLLVRNNTASTILAVMTVDGLSVMDGKKGSVEDNGYVVYPHQTLKVPGWRLNDDDIAKFVFEGKGKSYAAKKGEAKNVGVIGCAIFEEDCPPYFAYPSVTLTSTSYGGGTFSASHTGTPAVMDWCSTTSDDIVPCSHDGDEGVVSVNCCNVVEEQTSGPISDSTVTRSARRAKSKKMSTQNIGTGFGKKSSHGVTEVSFNRKDRPTEVFAIHYDDKQGLEARGIDLSRKVHVASPFPKDDEKGCVPPADWRG